MRHRVPLADDILDRKFRVLDHGFVSLIDYAGSDRRIAESAWVSSMGEIEVEHRDDAAIKRIITYMIKNQHSSPLESVALWFRCRIPIFVARQIVRHRTAKLNEVSCRYRTIP